MKKKSIALLCLMSLLSSGCTSADVSQVKKQSSESINSESTVSQANSTESTTSVMETEQSTMTSQKDPFEQSCPLGDTLASDLDGDGTEEKVTHNVTYNNNDNGFRSFSINGTDFTSFINKATRTNPYKDEDLNKFYLVDLDTSDKYKEIALVEEYGDYTPTTIFFRYDSGNLTYLGSTDAYLTDTGYKIPGDGTISCSIRKDLVQYSRVSVIYKLINNTIEEQPKDWYTVIMDSHTPKENAIRTDVDVYTEKSLDSKKQTLSPNDGSVTFPAHDAKHWAQVQTSNGDTYYLYLDSMFTLEDGRMTYDAFYDILIAD